MKYVHCLIVALVILTASLRTQAADVSPPDPKNWRFTNWTAQVELRTGNYRGFDKDVVLENNCRVVVSPGTLVEQAKFIGKRGTKWNIETCLFRKVEVIGELGSQFEAKDSVFDDCNLHKGGAWFVAHWSTRWRFENCVLAKEFLSSPCQVNDYSVQAIGCTFYDTTLPEVSFVRDDPSLQAQSRDLRFDKCRFVHCEVPESALATTIDCVFEDCRFIARNRPVWSKAAGSTVVNAFIVPGKTKPPQSYTNGHLQVNFKLADAKQEAGSTLAVTRTGDALKYAAVSEAGPVLVLGQAGARITPPAAAASARAVLSREAVNASKWATAALEETVPPDIRQNLTWLREGLLDEGKSARKASAASYKLGSELCNALIATLDERDQARVRAGYRDAEAIAKTKITSPDLESSRILTGLFSSANWPQFERERNQRAEIARQQNNQVALAAQAVRVEWASRAATLRQNLDESYKRYRESLRQDSSYQ
ncbi:MAG: hypothetical protein NT105_05125 [Verrucomicrobia bacterium]|nr:hypothetical protein [Verrucomicrobiota bacterium]